MSATNAFAADILKLIFTATNITNLADNAASGPITDWYISLHTASPGVGGNQQTAETTYTGYARISIARTDSGWTVTNGSCVNDNTVSFGQCTGGAQTITHVGLGTAASGAGALKIFNALTNPITLQNGNTPQFAAGQLNFTAS